MSRFGDRFCDAWADHQARWRNYRRHLRESGFSASEPVIQYFAHEVFHDRPVSRLDDDQPGVVVLNLLNSFALNQVVKCRISAGMDRSVDPAAFRTLVHFMDVSDFDVSALKLLDRPIYYQAELYRRGDRTAIHIDLVDAADSERQMETISVTFGASSFSDISSQIAGLLPTSSRSEAILFPSEPAI